MGWLEQLLQRWTGGSAVYDDRDFYDGLNDGAHIGLFWAWVLQRQTLVATAASLAPKLQQLERHEPELDFATLLEDRKLTQLDLNDEGNAFARAYYDHYLDDYADTLDDETLREASWEHFAVVCALLDGRYGAWVAEGRPRRAPRGGQPKRVALPEVPAAAALAALRRLDRLGSHRLGRQAARVLDALRRHAADDRLRAALLDVARHGRWPSATTAARAIAQRFDRESVMEALLALEQSFARWQLPRVEQLRELLRDLSRARAWQPARDLAEGVQRCVARDLLPDGHLKIAEAWRGYKVRDELEEQFCRAALAREVISPRLAARVDSPRLDAAVRARLALPACIHLADTLRARSFEHGAPILFARLDQLAKEGLSLDEGEGGHMVALAAARWHEWLDSLSGDEEAGWTAMILISALDGLQQKGADRVCGRAEFRELRARTLTFQGNVQYPFRMQLGHELRRLGGLTREGISLDEGIGQERLASVVTRWRDWIATLKDGDPDQNDVLCRDLDDTYEAYAESSARLRPEIQRLWEQLVDFATKDPRRDEVSVRLLRALWQKQPFSDALIADAAVWYRSADIPNRRIIDRFLLRAPGQTPSGHADSIRKILQAANAAAASS
jgi:hypothetical protein